MSLENSQSSINRPWLKPTKAEQDFLNQLKIELCNAHRRNWTVTFREGVNLHYKDCWVVSDGNGEACIAFVRGKARLTIEFVPKPGLSNSAGNPIFRDRPKNGFRWQEIVAVTHRTVQQSWQDNNHKMVGNKKFNENRMNIATIAEENGYRIEHWHGATSASNVIFPSDKKRDSYSVQIYSVIEDCSKDEVDVLLARLANLGVIPLTKNSRT